MPLSNKEIEEIEKRAADLVHVFWHRDEKFIHEKQLAEDLADELKYSIHKEREESAKIAEDLPKKPYECIDERAVAGAIAMAIRWRTYGTWNG